jgi:hypothetical protein
VFGLTGIFARRTPSVMPGLEPGISMPENPDCRVTPGNDDL